MVLYGNIRVLKNFNKNKINIILDLKTEKGLKEATELISKADVLVENFTPELWINLA